MSLSFNVTNAGTDVRACPLPRKRKPRQPRPRVLALEPSQPLLRLVPDAWRLIVR